MPAPVPNEDMPEVKRLLQPLVGRWKGRFKVFEPDGTLIRRIEVRQEYFWTGDVLCGDYLEEAADGNVTHARARLGENEGALFCEVKKSDATGTLHLGKWEEHYLFWHRRDDSEGVVECFKEFIVHAPKGRIYMVDGFGVYGTNQYLFEGQYWEQRDEDDEELELEQLAN